MDFQAMGLCECEVFRSIKAQLSVFVVGNSFVCVCVCVCVGEQLTWASFCLQLGL